MTLRAVGGRRHDTWLWRVRNTSLCVSNSSRCPRCYNTEISALYSNIDCFPKQSVLYLGFFSCTFANVGGERSEWGYITEVATDFFKLPKIEKQRGVSNQQDLLRPHNLWVTKSARDGARKTHTTNRGWLDGCQVCRCRLFQDRD